MTGELASASGESGTRNPDMSDDNAPRKPPRIWPGMPTPRGEGLLFLLLLLPSIIGVVLAMLLSVIAYVRYVLS